MSILPNLSNNSSEITINKNPSKRARNDFALSTTFQINGSEISGLYFYVSDNVLEKNYHGTLKQVLRDMYYNRLKSSWIAFMMQDNPYFGFYNDLYSFIQMLPSNLQINKPGPVDPSIIRDMIYNFKLKEDKIMYVLTKHKYPHPDNYYDFENAGVESEVFNIPAYISTELEEMDLDENDKDFYTIYFDMHDYDLINIDKYFNWKENMNLFDVLFAHILRDKSTEWLLVQLSLNTLIYDQAYKYYSLEKNTIYYHNSKLDKMEIVSPPERYFEREIEDEGELEEE